MMFKKEILQNQKKILQLTVKERAFDVQEIIDVLPLQKIIALLGGRRVGKTFLSFYIVQSLIKRGLLEKEQIVYLDFSGILQKNIDLQEVLASYYALFPDKQPFFVFDEVQELHDFPKKLIQLLGQGYNILITGSNAHMLSRELSTLLRGKVYAKEIFPLDFREYLGFKNISLQKNDIVLHKPRYVHALQEYCRWGGFPEIVLTDNEVAKENILKNYFDVMIYKDLQDRYSIKNDYVLKFFIKRIVGSFGKEVNINKIYNDLKSHAVKVSKDTLYNFYEYLDDVYLISSLQNYWAQIKGVKTVYLNDISFSFFAGADNIGRRFENMVYHELKKRYGELFFLKKEHEIDFYIPQQNLYIQVVHTLHHENIERETKYLVKQSGKKIVIYAEKEEEYCIEGIQFISGVDFFLGEKKLSELA